GTRRCGRSGSAPGCRRGGPPRRRGRRRWTHRSRDPPGRRSIAPARWTTAGRPAGCPTQAFSRRHLDAVDVVIAEGDALERQVATVTGRGDVIAESHRAAQEDQLCGGDRGRLVDGEDRRRTAGG